MLTLIPFDVIAKGAQEVGNAAWNLMESLRRAQAIVDDAPTAVERMEDQWRALSPNTLPR